MKTILVILAFLHLARGASIADVTCPDSCLCQIKDEHIEASCTSYEFIKKLIPKQVSTIVRLNINNASLVSIDSKLKYLKNLHILDLSDNAISSIPSQFPYLPKLKTLNLHKNKLKSLAFSQLPKNLQVLDLSDNSFENFPKDWTSLTQLETLHFFANPIDCVCDNLAIYEQLKIINISKNLTCHYPKEFHGRSLESVNCSLIKENLLNTMLGDESGSGTDELSPFDDRTTDDQEEFIKAEEVTQYPEQEHRQEEEEEDEGSGEGSGGMIPILPIPVSPKACHFNCSTPSPVGGNDEVNASQPPNAEEQAKILFNDIFQLEEDVTTQKQQLTTEVPETTPSEAKEEEPIVKISDKSQVETFPTNDTVVGEMERASTGGSDAQSIYIIVGLVMAFAVFVGIYYFNKKRNQKKKNIRRRNKSNENGFGEEMKPLGKTAEANNAEQNAPKPAAPAETAPLLNGQNGKINEEKNGKAPTDDDLEEVELRKSSELIQGSLTPQPERVTIKAGELPDSIPKTPLLVHRQVNSDGEIITTAVNSN